MRSSAGYSQQITKQLKDGVPPHNVKIDLTPEHNVKINSVLTLPPSPCNVLEKEVIEKVHALGG
jgi:hypothetical protein